MKTKLILLAAGQSKRFDGIKQIANFNGQSMICHCLAQYYQDDTWIEGIADGHVVLGANAAAISEVLPKNINKYVVETWQQGMGHTLSKIVQAIGYDTTHLLVGLTDQVLITKYMIKTLLDGSKSHPKNIIAAKYANIVGVPCIFPRQYFSHLSQLSGDNGAKLLLQQYSQQVKTIAMPKAAFDIDTTEDLLMLSNHSSG